MGKSSRDDEKGPAGAEGETGRRPRVGVPVPRHGSNSLGVGPSAVRLEGIPGRAEVTGGDTARAQLAPAPGRPEIFF